MAPGRRDSENSCSSGNLELAPCPCWLVSHLLPHASLQVAAEVAGRGAWEPRWGCHRTRP